MSTVNSQYLSLSDQAKRKDPDGKYADIVEMLSQSNPVLDDMHWEEGNLETGHRITMRTGLPTVAWRLLNQGVQSSKSRTAQVDEACGMMEAWSVVDKRLADLGGNPAAFRIQEAKAFIEAMNQEFASTLWYGNSSTSPEEFTGLAARFSSLSAANGQNIVNGGSSDTDNSSIYLIGWGANSIHGIYPKGSMVGLRHTDHGSGVIENVNGVAGATMVGYRDQFEWDCGIAMRDWRYVIRIANIDCSALATETGAADLNKLMIRALKRRVNPGLARWAFYMNRTCEQALDIQSRDVAIAGGGIKYEQVGGKEVASFRGIPVKISDALLQTEAAVS